MPALFRVRAAFDEAPELETWLERGRISVAAARSLRELGPPAATSMLADPETSRGAA